MWGHDASCQCPLCLCFLRLFYLVRLGSQHPGFAVWGATRLRHLEAEVRDELQRLGPPPAVGAGTPPAVAPPAAGSSGESKASLSQTETARPEALLHLSPKVPPPLPPPRDCPPEPEGKPPTAKQEPLEEKDPASLPRVRNSSAAEGSPRASSSKPQKKDKDRHPKGDRRSPRSPRSRSARRRSRSRERRREREERKPSRARFRGKERKARSERPPEPKDPPQRSWRHWGPREPNHPPQAEERGGEGHCPILTTIGGIVARTKGR